MEIELPEYLPDNSLLNNHPRTNLLLKQDAFVEKGLSFFVPETTIPINTVFFVAKRPDLVYYVSSRGFMMRNDNIKQSFKRLDGHQPTTIDLINLGKGKKIYLKEKLNNDCNCTEQ